MGIEKFLNEEQMLHFHLYIFASAVRSLWVLDNICHELQGYLNSEYLYQIF